jgi:hypothetical protein
MKIEELKDKQSGVNIELKVIYDRMEEQSTPWGQRSKTIVVADVDSSVGSVTALLDLFDDDIEKFKFGDKIKVVNGYAKKVTTKRGEQFVITYGFDKSTKKLIGHYELTESSKKE